MVGGLKAHIAPSRRHAWPMLLLLATLTSLPVQAGTLADTLPASTQQRLSQLVALGVPIDQVPANQADLSLAHALHCDRARKGSIDGLASLGWMYLQGAGVAADPTIASSLLLRAAAHGNAQARQISNALTGFADRLPQCLLLASAPLRAAVKTSPKQKQITRTINRMARHYQLDPRLVMAIAQIESGFRTDAVSTRDAVGLMQLTADTAARFKVADRTDWVQNLRGGMAYLRWLLGYFRGDVMLAAAAYNAGEGNVVKFRGVPPFRETMRYVQKLRAIYHRDWHPFDASIRGAPVLAAMPKPPVEIPIALNE